MARAAMGVAALFAVACGGPTISERVVGDDQTGGSAMGIDVPQCKGNAAYAEPLIVDLPPTVRLDLEVAMKSGIAVVSYDCKTLEIINSCKVAGQYTFAGVSRKEQVVQMNTTDELAANLPFSAGKLGGELKRGKSIDLAIVMVGKQSTTQVEVERNKLEGSCDKATHFVRAATLGAFSMTTGSKGKVAAVAEMFGKGTDNKSETERKRVTKDGELEACRKSTPEADAPPSECGSPIRVEIMPVVAQLTGKSSEGAKEVKNPCPAGFKFAEGKCTKNAGAPHLCAADDQQDCLKQCELGHAESCFNAGVILIRSGKTDDAGPFMEKACAGDFGEGCSRWGFWQLPDSMDDEGAAAKVKEALATFEKGCTLGAGYACDGVAGLHADNGYGIEDHARAVKFYRRGCDLGDDISCWHLGRAMLEGKIMEKDLREGVQVFGRACQGGDASMCAELAEIIIKGKHGVPKILDTARVLYEYACRLDIDYCREAGDAHEAVDAEKAKELWTIGCAGGKGKESSCEKIGVKMKK